MTAAHPHSQPSIVDDLRHIHASYLGASYNMSILLTAADRIEELEEALLGIRQIVLTPTTSTKHWSAADHFQADFDQIRRIINTLDILDVARSSP